MVRQEHPFHEGEPLSSGQVSRCIVGIYENRKQLAPFSELAGKATQELFVVGIELNYIIFQELSFLENRASEGVKVRLLMIDPGDQTTRNSLVENLSDTLAIPQLDRMLTQNIQRVQDWRSGLPKQTQDRIELRLTTAVPSHIITFVDPNGTTGLAHIELIPPGFDPGDRPSIDISAESGGKLYQGYVSEYRRLWEKARVVEQE